MDDRAPISDPFSQLRQEQSQRWQRGERALAETFVSRQPSLLSDSKLLVELVVAEFQLRKDLGEDPSIEEYLRRFPPLASQLRQLLEECESSNRQPPANPHPTESTADPASDRNDAAKAVTVRADFAAEPTVDGSHLVGQRFGDYVILQAIARGGMGIVYKARQVSLNRIVALKMILAGQMASGKEIERFQAEAEAAATLDHPNIVPIFEVGNREGQHYFAMGYVDGPSLAMKLRDGCWAPHDAAALLRQIAEAVQYAHAHGIIHRDLKPHNILLTSDGQPRITDFGLAKRLEGASELTASGQILGTPNYMPPEQARGKTREVGPLSDVYALGGILYALLTGQPPFVGETPFEVVTAVIEREPISPRQLNPRVDRDLETVTLKCLDKDPAKRYSSARELSDDLGRFLRREPINARPIGSFERSWRWCRRKPVVASLVSAVVLTLMAGSIVSTLFGIQAYRQADKADREAAQRIVAETERKTAERARELETYYATISRVKEAAANPSHGWTWKALDDLHKISTLNVVNARAEELRTLAADVALRHDLRPVARIGEDIVDVGSLAFSPDGTKLAIGESLGHLTCRIQIWSVPQHAKVLECQIATLKTSIKNLAQGRWVTNLDTIPALAWSPDGRWIVAGTRWGKLFHFDLRQSHPEAVGWDANQGEIGRLDFSPDGETLYSTGNSLRRWAVSSGWREIPTAPNNYKSVAVSPDRGWLAVLEQAGYPCHLRMLRPEKLDTVPSWPQLADNIGAVAFSQDGRFVGTSTPEGIAIREARTGELIATWNLKDTEGEFDVTRLAFSPDGSILIGWDTRKRVHFWTMGTDLENGLEIMPPLASGGENSTFAVNPKGGWLAIASSGSPHTSLYEWKQPRSSWTLAQAGTVRGLDLSPDGKSLAAALNTVLPLRRQQWNESSEWDLASRKIVKESRITFPRVARMDWFRSVVCPTTLAWQPTGDLIARDTEWCGVMIYPARGHAGRVGIVHHPELDAPTELDPSRFAKCKLSHGATVRSDPAAQGGQAAVLGGAVPPGGERTLALSLKEVPVDKTKYGEGASVIASAKLLGAQPFNTACEFGSFEDRPQRNGSMTRVWNVEVADQGSHWYVLDSFRKTQRDLASKYVYLKTLGGADTSLIADRLLMVPVSPEDSGLDNPLEVALARFRPTSKASAADDPLPLLEVGPFCWSPDGRRLWGLVHHEIKLVSWRTDDLEHVASWRNGTSPPNIASLCVGNRWVVCGRRKGNLALLPARDGELQPAANIPGPGGPIRALALGPHESWVV
ncbi:MAG TPA: WD40 repeat domain-containing serine/threonine protein kinase, partial [Planctomycetaceae bacterium]|nr:WD40 repeat domain-containing serine/threonine protein kinase [Planctomycetaceae bacterium]